MALNVLHINTLDVEGGAARAAFRISGGLRKIGVDSRMVVQRRRESHPAVMQPLRGGLAWSLKCAISARISRLQKTGNTSLHSMALFKSGLADWINRSDADIVNLHWVADEMLSIEEIGRITKPMCWTMHDMWPFSGSEHYDDLQSEGRYVDGYTANNRPQTYRGLDMDAWVWRRKKRAWHDRHFHLIAPSQWMAACASKSALFSGRPCSVIPNGIDLDVFRPIDQRLARRLLGLQEDRRYILFGAMSSTGDRRKGFHLLQPALKSIAQRTEISANTELLVFGAHAAEREEDFGMPIRYMGSMYDDIALTLLYSAADVFAAPSMQDNLPNTLVEAQACGTPCVAFNIGGMSDLIDHGMTGYLANAFEPDSMAEGLAHALNFGGDAMRSACRSRAQRFYSDTTIAGRYEALYQQMLAGAPGL